LSSPSPGTSRALRAPTPENRAAWNRSISSPNRRWSTLSRLKIFGSVACSTGLDPSSCSIASSTSCPLEASVSSGPATRTLACVARYSHRARRGTQNTPALRYSSTSSSNEAACSSVYPSPASSAAISSLRSSKASETYLRNTSPRITSLYWLASMEPRSLSAAFHSVSLSCFIVVAVLGVATSCCLPRGTALLIPSRAGVRRSHHSPLVRHRLPHRQ